MSEDEDRDRARFIAETNAAIRELGFREWNRLRKERGR